MKTTDKPLFTVDLTHDENTFMALSHAQYDFFCKRNYIVRSLLSVVCLCAAVLNLDKWWAYVLIVYGVYLFTGKYNQSNYTARKLINGIKKAGLKFPSSRYIFEKDRLRVISMPDHEELEPLPYDEIRLLGKDSANYYIFRDEHGGYLIPRASLGEDDERFAEFMSEATGKLVLTKRTPPYKKTVHYLKQTGLWPFKGWRPPGL